MGRLTIIPLFNLISIKKPFFFLKIFYLLVISLFIKMIAHDSDVKRQSAAAEL